MNQSLLARKTEDFHREITADPEYIDSKQMSSTLSCRMFNREDFCVLEAERRSTSADDATAAVCTSYTYAQRANLRAPCSFFLYGMYCPSDSVASLTASAKTVHFKFSALNISDDARLIASPSEVYLQGCRLAQRLI